MRIYNLKFLHLKLFVPLDVEMAIFLTNEIFRKKRMAFIKNRKDKENGSFREKKNNLKLRKKTKYLKSFERT